MSIEDEIKKAEDKVIWLKMKKIMIEENMQSECDNLEDDIMYLKCRCGKYKHIMENNP